MSQPGLVASALRVGPHAGAHRVAVRAGLSVLVPLLVLWLIGHQEWSAYAAFGAFTSLYGRNHVLVDRRRMQITLALILAAAVVLGVAVGLSLQVVRGLHRLTGTAVGLVLAFLLLGLHLDGVWLIVGVVALQLAAELLVGRNYALALVVSTPLALLMGELVVTVPTGVLIRDRAVETLIGVVIGLVVGWFSRRR